MPGCALILAACAILFLPACGQTGPLYLPDKTAQTEPGDEPPVSEEAAEDTLEVEDDTR